MDPRTGGKGGRGGGHRDDERCGASDGRRPVRRPRGRLGPGTVAIAAAVVAFGMAVGAAALAPGGAVADSVVVARHGARTSPTIALTIDDGSDPVNCRTVVDILERRHVAATFFPAAKWIPLDPALWRWIASLGFPIGNHTAHHALLSKLTLDEQVAEIAQGKAEIEAAIGEPIIPALRPPGGDWDADTPIAAGRTGARLVLLWDTTFADTSTDGVLQHYIDHAIAGVDGSVILLHCGPAITPQVLEPAIDSYLSRGFRFVTVPEMFGLPGPTPSFGDLPTDAPAASPTDVPVPSATDPAEPSAAGTSSTAPSTSPSMMPVTPTASSGTADPATMGLVIVAAFGIAGAGLAVIRTADRKRASRG